MRVRTLPFCCSSRSWIIRLDWFWRRSPTSASEASASRLRLPRMAVDASPRFGGALSERPSSNPARWLFCGRCRSPKCTTSVLGPAEKDLRADATPGTSDCAAAVTTDWYRADSGYRCFGTDGIVNGGWPCGAAAGATVGGVPLSDTRMSLRILRGNETGFVSSGRVPTFDATCSRRFLSFLNGDLTGKDGRQRRKATFTSGEADAHRPGQAPPGRPAPPRHGPSHRPYPPHTRDVPARRPWLPHKTRAVT